MQYRTPPPRARRRHPFAWLIVFVVLLGAGNYLRPLPSVTPSPTMALSRSLAAGSVAIPWPAYGQASLATPEDGVVAATQDQTPLATASIAKVITALCVLQKYPLTKDADGPTYTITAADVALYQQYASNNGSLTPVQLGERLTERQLLEAMMIPSANNIADTAAIWAFGSMDAYHDYANAFVRSQGMTRTTVADDASGFSSATVSTASDLAKLGLLAINQPALKEIMRLPAVNLPVAGTVTNYNQLLGSNGIYGIKTGNNDANLGALLFASSHTVNGQELDLVGTVMGADSLRQAFVASTALTVAGQQMQRVLVAATKSQTIVTYTAAWGERVSARAERDLYVPYWQTNAVSVTPQYDTISAGRRGSVGSVEVKTGSRTVATAVSLERPLAGPSFWWRVTRF